MGLQIDRELARLWQANPASVEPDLHTLYCRHGELEIDNERYVCPVCRYQASITSRERQVEHTLRRLHLERYLEHDWTTLHPIPGTEKIVQAIQRLPEILPDADNLLLYGPPGRGKTQLAIMALREAARHDLSCDLVNVGMLAVQVRSAYDTDHGPTEEEAIERIARSQLLVLDDLGAGETANATLERRLLYLGLDRRHNARKMTLVTSNLTPRELMEAIGQRCYNRLQPMTAVHLNHSKNFRTTTGGRTWE